MNNQFLVSELAKAMNKKKPGRRGRNFAVIVLVIFSAFLLFLGNIFFWAGNTLTKTDRYVSTVAPLAKDPVIQSAVAHYTTKQIFNNVDVEPYISSALPSQASFLSPILTNQLEKQTESVIKTIVKSQKFTDTWTNTQRLAHREAITIITSHNGTGTIHLSEIYQHLARQLKNTPLSFLADKQLPNSIGNITIAHVKWLPAVKTLVVNIDTWRLVATLLFFTTSCLAILLARNRAKVLWIMSVCYGLVMTLSLGLIYAGKYIVASKFNSAYQDAAEHAYQIMTTQLTTQTTVLLLLSVLIAITAWVGGKSTQAKRAKQPVQALLSTHLHGLIFKSENIFTKWVGRFKETLQWLIVFASAVIFLLGHLAVSRLIIVSLIALVFILLIETLAKTKNA